MKRIELLETPKSAKELEEIGIHWKVCLEYHDSMERELDTIDFSDCIHDSEVMAIVNTLRKCGIGKVTISSGFSGVVETIHLFEANGCKLIGMTMINSKMRNWDTKKFDLIPAFEIMVGCGA